MQKLESFKCADSKSLSLKVKVENKEYFYFKWVFFQTVTTLMDQCPHLTACQDLDYWESISPQQLTQFKQYLKQSNIKLKISDEKESELDYIGGLCTTANLPENLCDFNNWKYLYIEKNILTFLQLLKKQIFIDFLNANLEDLTT